MDSVDTLQLDSREPLPRETLGGFSLVDKMATGGMATVYLGHRTGSTGATQVAAVKVMFPRLVDDAEYVEMFFDEARLTSSIKHPYVCKVLDYGVEHGFHYLATEYVLGETWADLVDALHQTPEGKAVAPLFFSHIVAQACEGLHAVHETQDENGKPLGIVHRDVSPQNIMVCYDGTVRVLDFGIASATERLHETRNGVLKGHVAYMAPEQAQILPIDRRCDIWPLGVMLWEGATGRRLFKRTDTRATMKAVTSEDLAPLLRDCDPLPTALMSVIERSVVRDPDARFATARHMQGELASLSLGATPMTSTQVASWMRHLFAARFEEKRQRLRTTIAPSCVPLEVSQSVVRSTSRTPMGSAVDGPNFRTAAANGVLSAASFARVIYLHFAARLASLLPKTGQRAMAPLLALAVIAGALVVRFVPNAERESPKEKKAPAESLPSAVPAVRTAFLAVAEGAPTGVLDVRASGSQVRVECEGRDLGVTPLRVELAAGRHQFRIVPGGAEAVASADVVIESGEHYLMEIERSGPAAPAAH